MGKTASIDEMLDRLDDLYTFGEGWNSGNYDPERVDTQREALSAAMDAMQVVNRLPGVLEALYRLKWIYVNACNKEAIGSTERVVVIAKAQAFNEAARMLNRAIKGEGGNADE